MIHWMIRCRFCGRPDISRSGECQDCTTRMESMRPKVRRRAPRKDAGTLRKARGLR